MKHEVQATMLATIGVKYRFRDNYHVFTSNDVKGLYVASKDARIAFDSVGPVLETLIELQTKNKCEIEPAVSFDEFLRQQDEVDMPHYPVLSDRTFIVRCAA